MSIKAVIFDMDGTVLHTLPDLTMVTNRTMEQLGYPQHTQEEVETFVGNGAERLVTQACPPGTSPEDCKRALKRWQSIYLECGDDLTEPFPGILDTLRELRRRGIKTAVLSNKFDAAVRELSDHYFPGLLDKSLGEIPPTPRKPDPTMLQGIMDRHGLQPEEIAMVGDRIYTDTAMAHNAGAVGVLVLSGETTLETAEKVAEDARTNPDPEFYPPDVIVRDIAELGELIRAAKGL